MNVRQTLAKMILPEDLKNLLDANTGEIIIPETRDELLGLAMGGKNEWFEVAKQMGVKGVMLMAADGTIHMTPNLEHRIYFDVEPKPSIIFSKPLTE